MDRPQWLLDLNEVQLLALCIWSEARGEPYLGKLAVGHVVQNRVAAQSWFGQTMGAVILKPWQFSWFNEPTGPVQVDDACLAIADLTARNVTIDPTGGATHFHADYVKPDWAALMKFTGQIGRHLFYLGS